MKYDYENLADEKLFELLSKDRDISNRAFNELYKRYSGKIYSFLYRLLGNKFFIKDIYQDVFARVYRIGAEGKNKNLYNFRSYLYQTAKNACLNHFKSEGRISEVHTDFMITYPEDTSNVGDTVELVRQAVSRLPENLKEVFILAEYEEMNYPAIAEMIGDTQVNVRVKIYRARKMLKDIVVSMRREMNNMVENE
jgi:RNA polymerase sigma-70 factor (ECF subfamily)